MFVHILSSRSTVMHYKIAICEDSAADQTYIRKLAEHWAEDLQHTVQVNIFPSAESFLFYYTAHKDYDILLLDIEMGDIDGVALARKLRQEDETIQIIFITGFPDFIAEGYEVCAVHYLLKPVSREALARALGQAAANLKKTAKTVIFTVDKEEVRVVLSDIMYVEAFAHACRITALDSRMEVKKSISEIEKILGEGFIRTHRSYLAGISYIKRISKIEVTLDNGERLPLSRSNYQPVNQAFIQYYRGESRWEL